MINLQRNLEQLLSHRCLLKLYLFSSTYIQIAKVRLKYIAFSSQDGWPSEIAKRTNLLREDGQLQ